MARHRTERVGTWETLSGLQIGVSADKPEIGKEAEMPGRESDMLIVAMKQGNACGAKGHALLVKSRGDIIRTQIWRFNVNRI